jgi:hypothetical protein
MNELQHHGVKGMKWGVRKAESKSIVSTSKNKRHEEYVKRRGIRNPVSKQIEEYTKRNGFNSNSDRKGGKLKKAHVAIALGGIGGATIGAIMYSKAAKLGKRIAESMSSKREM